MFIIILMWYPINKEVFIMLINYNTKNFGPFNKLSGISMHPGKVYSRFSDNVTYVSGAKKILKTSLLVGENAGGKTSFFRSLHYLQYLFINGARPRIPTDLINVFAEDAYVEYNLEVLAKNNKIYTYYLKLNDERLVEESLYVRSINKTSKDNALIYSVTQIELLDTNDLSNKLYGCQFDLNDRYFSKEMRKTINDTMSLNELFIRLIKSLRIEIVLPFFEWVTESLSVQIGKEALFNEYHYIDDRKKQLEIMKKDSFLEIFRLVDGSIKSITINDDAPFQESRIVRTREDGKTFDITLKDDSSGVKDFFRWSIFIWRVIHEDLVVFADEVDRVLNVILAEHLITYINACATKGQFIFSTHNIFHLNTNQFMKEQLNFVTRDEETLESEIYSLADFKDYRYEKNKIYDLYLKGLLGGIPNG